MKQMPQIEKDLLYAYDLAVKAKRKANNQAKKLVLIIGENICRAMLWQLRLWLNMHFLICAFPAVQWNFLKTQLRET